MEKYSCPYKNASKQYTSSPAHLPLYLSQVVRSSQHTFGMFTRKPGKVQLCPLEHSDESPYPFDGCQRCVCTFIQYCLTVSCDRFPGKRHWWGLSVQNSASQALLCTRISQGSSFRAGLGQGLRGRISNAFPDDGQCWSLGHTLSSEAMLCSWVKSQQVRALPWVRVNSGGRKPGNHHLLTLGGWWRGILPAWFSKSPDHCCHLGNFKNIWHQVSPSQELLVSLAWGVAGAYVLPEAPQSICCVELAITAPAVDANGLNDIWRSLSFSSSTSLQIHLVLLSF